ncbi:hypothetical protein LUZ60_009618 [Juncus effusus]|nr:hypothetical protein LUZ60_009618 [Juncus effusus]
MSSGSEAEDEGPFALQLQKWQEGSVKIELSEFSKGFISPTRRILLLLSKNHEAVLLSLIPGKISEIESRRLPIFESSPVISGVKSLAWGSFPDSSSELETSSFEQLLIVSNTRGIFVHIFRSVQPTETDPTLTDGESKGKWIDWGPNKELDASSSDTKKNWLRTFCTETESTVQNGKFLTNIPSEKTLPSYANVVSFDIYGAILSFLESKEGFCGTGYECSRLFSSPNNQFIGFVLKFEENVGTDVSYRFMVVVMRIYKWGFEWVFSVDPYRFETSTELEEVQLSDDFLFCLDGSGLVTFWDLNSGNFVTQFNVLNSRKSGFKRILVASNSNLLGIIDKFGVVYLVALDEILTKKNGILSKYHYNGTLTAWTVAGNDIGSLIYRSNIPNSQPLDDFEVIRPSKRRKYNNIKNKGLKPIRKVYLPPYRAKDETETLVCLSPFGITRLVKNNDFNSTKIIHTDLHVGPTKTRESLTERESIGCFFKGCLYLITQEGISVILPSISISNRGENCVKIDDLGFGGSWKPWQIEVLDRVILYEEPKEADQLCLDNGWDLRFSRMRQMQLALHYSKFDEIEQCLNMLVDVNLAEEGVLRLLFASVYQIFVRVSSENEVAMSSRLIALAARFATKVIHKYALIDQKKGSAVYSRRLDEMAFFLEVIRDLQSRVSAKSKKLSETADEMDSMDTESLPTDSSPPENNININSNNPNNNNNNNNLSLTLTESSSPNQSIEPTQLKRIVISENVRDMMARWELSNFDLKNVVRDALKSGRLPLAVLQLQLLRQKHAELAVPDSLDERLGGDTFGEVRGIGRSIAYDLFIQGETELGVETLERLGEDMESVLRQLLFGTVRRSLRQNIAIEMKKHGFLRPNEMKILDRISLVEKLYPRSNFWGTYNKTKENPSETNDDPTPQLTLHVRDNSPVLCGELDGAILGIWSDISSSSASSSRENSDEVSSDGYWACALVWSDAWDQRTIDRILLDRPYQTGILVPWESQFEYHIAHNNSQEILNLIDIIPSSLISEGILTINTENSTLIPNNGLYICANEEIEPSYLEIPNVNILKHFNSDKCTLYLRTLIEEEFAKRNIFIRDYWNNVGDLIQVIARAGLIFDFSEINESNEKSLEIIEFLEDSDGDVKSKEGFYKLLVHYCVQNDLPYLLDFYLDQWNLVQDHRSLNLLMDATGDCEWAKWLLFSTLKGYEYESSFSNARWKLNGSPGNSLQLEGRLRTPDDFLTEGLGEMAALATLMYSTIPIERCLSVESLNGPGLRKYSTIWRSLVSACSGGDSYGSLSFNANKVFGKSVLSDYLNWRYGIFASSGGDSSLLQMLPITLPVSVRRLVQLFIQGTFSMQSLADATQILKESDESHLHGIRKNILNAIGTNCSNPASLEASVQKIVQMELFPIEENGFKVENYLNRSRVLSALNDMIKERATELNSTILRNDPSVQPNINWDTRLILEPLNQTEKSILLSVIPLAITNFDDSSLVASSAFFFELCGVSFDMIRLDINALKRISSHYNQSNNQTLIPTLARELAEDYLKSDYLQIITQNPNISKYAPSSKILDNILHHLEKASLPVMQEGQSCGFWLKNGNGDYSIIREKQSEQSKKWNLVTEFCQMHNLPLSTKYLALLANDNDWVGFLTEAQLGGFSADVIIQVASKEIRDTRLRTHVLTVLKSMQSTKKKANGEVYIEEENDTPAELFAVIAGCEKQKCPGEALLRKARDLCWPLLAIVASCFNDTSPLSCLTVWLEITASKSGLIKVDKDKSSGEISRAVGSAVESTNKLLPEDLKTIEIRYNRQNTKRQRISGATCNSTVTSSSRTSSSSSSSTDASAMQNPILDTGPQEVVTDERDKLEEELSSLSDMVAMLCEKQLFLPLLRAFEMFLPSFSLLPFIRSLQAFSQMRLSEASAHLASFSARIKEDPSSSSSSSSSLTHLNRGPWLSNTAVKAGESVLATCPSLYEKRCLLELLSSADFGDGGGSAAYFGRLYWKITRSGEEGEGERLAELEDGEMLGELERMGRWDEAREWARRLEAVSPAWKSAFHHATESQAEAMVSEWKEFLWDFPQERAALWGHCQALFVRYSFPPLQAGLFFLKHAEAIEKEIPARELHEVLLFALQWLSGTITQVPPVYPLHLLREIETRVWLLAVESETESKSEPDFSPSSSVQTLIPKSSSSPIEQTAFIISKMDAHINSTRVVRPAFSRDTLTTKSKKKGKSSYLHLRQANTENIDNNTDISSDEYEVGVSNWEERVGPVEMERAVLSLLEFGQISAAKQLQQKLSPAHVPDELTLIDAALKLAKFSSSSGGGEISLSVLDESVRSVVRSLDLPIDANMIDPSKALEALTLKCGEGRGRGLCKRVIAVVRAARVLGLGFSVAFAKQPIELLQLLSLKAQDSFEEAKLLVRTHSMPAASIAHILTESFFKGLQAAYYGGCIESTGEEGPAPLLWRSRDFLKWAELCPSEPEIGHALMRLVMTGQDFPHACEVELLILAHHFYTSSACLDGISVLVTFAANRVESYVSESDFPCLARLITGVTNFHSLSFILDILIENGRLELLLQKYSAAAEAATGSAAAVRGFRMAVLTALKRFNPRDLDALAMVYNHFDMKHEASTLLDSRATTHIDHWSNLPSRDRQNRPDLLLAAMRHLIEASETLSSIDAGLRTHSTCAKASLLTLQTRIPDVDWVGLEDREARELLEKQVRFQEAVVVAQGYGIQPAEWARVFWNLMSKCKPDLVERFVAEFVAVFPLQPSMLQELARIYRSDVTAKGDQSHFGGWLNPTGLPAFRSVLKRTRDLKVRMQIATMATGFKDVVEACAKLLDKVPENAGPLVLRRGHGGAYLPLM